MATVMLKIELESSELSGTAGDAGSLITNKRSVKTNGADRRTAAPSSSAA